jgi:NAD+ synthase
MGLRLTPSILDLDWTDVEAKITRFIKDYVDKIGAKGIVMGLSGGVDSSVVAALSARALGGDKVLGLMLPEEETRSSEDINYAELVVRKLKLRSQLCDITPTLKTLYKTIPAYDPSDKVCKGNIKARTRMIYIYYYANKLSMIVCGSSDKSETMMGYFTKWGDVAADISPIMDLYKTQVRKLAQHMGVPKAIIARPPTPALWPGQTAEGELGIGYEILDLILYGLEHFMTIEETAKQMHLKRELVHKVRQRWLAAEHKRRMLLTTKLEYRTVGMDFRLKRG